MSSKPEPIGGNIYPLVFGVLVFAVTILGAGITIYNSFHVPLANAVSCETAARVKADEDIQSNFNAFLMQNEKDHGRISNQLKIICKFHFKTCSSKPSSPQKGAAEAMRVSAHTNR